LAETNEASIRAGYPPRKTEAAPQYQHQVAVVRNITAPSRHCRNLDSAMAAPTGLVRRST